MVSLLLVGGSDKRGKNIIKGKNRDWYRYCRGSHSGSTLSWRQCSGGPVVVFGGSDQVWGRIHAVKDGIMMEHQQAAARARAAAVEAMGGGEGCGAEGGGGGNAETAMKSGGESRGSGGHGGKSGVGLTEESLRYRGTSKQIALAGSER